MTPRSHNTATSPFRTRCACGCMACCGCTHPVVRRVKAARHLLEAVLCCAEAGRPGPEGKATGHVLKPGVCCAEAGGPGLPNTAPFNVLLTCYTLFERDSEEQRLDRKFLKRRAQNPDILKALPFLSQSQIPHCAVIPLCPHEWATARMP